MRRYLCALALVLLAGPAMAAPAFDACASPAGAGGTGTLSWTHTPVGTPRGATVVVGQIGGGTDEISSVTYGGTAMTEVTSSPNCKATTETGCTYAFHLGVSVPTGAQTVVVNVTGSSIRRAVSCTVTAGADTTVDATGTISSDALDDPSGTINTTAGTETFVAAVLFSGESTGSQIAKGNDYTEIVEDSPGGGGIVSVQRRTANPTGGAVTFNWITNSAEDAVGLGVAVREGSGGGGGGGGTPACYIGSLTPGELYALVAR